MSVVVVDITLDSALTGLLYVHREQILLVFWLGLCDNENSYITIMQLNITIITITVLHKIHLRMVVSCRMLE